MAAEPLVEDDIKLGERILRALDSAGYPISAAFWLAYEEPAAWKLWIASKKAESNLQFAYMELSAALKSYGIRDFDLSRIQLVPTTDGIVSAISFFGIDPAHGYLRLSRTTVSGVYIEGALVYRTMRQSPHVVTT